MTIPKNLRRVCIVGAGHASHVLIALFGAHRPGSWQPPVKVTVLAPYADKAERLIGAVQHGITAIHPDGSTVTTRPILVTKDPAKALDDVQLVLIPLPAFVVKPMLELIAPHLTHGAYVGAFPAQAGQQWVAPNILDISPEGKNIKFFGVDKLPFACRVVEFGHTVQVCGYKKAVALACIPNRIDLCSHLINILDDFIPRLSVYSVPNFLVISLSPGNSCVHPARMYGFFAGRLGGRYKVAPLFYEDMDDYSAGLIAKVSKEMVAVSRATEARAAELGMELNMSGVLDVEDVAKKIYAPTDTSSLASIFRTCPETAGIKAPVKLVENENGEIEEECDWSSRYFSEDIPGLCMLHGLGKLVDVGTPTTDMLIHWGQKVSSQKVKFLLENDTLNENVSRDQCYAPQLWGVNTFEELLALHTEV